MVVTRLAALSLIAAGTLAIAAPLPTFAADGSATVKSVDKDSDGTIDMAEAKQAAMAKFKAADKDNDGTVDSKEAGMDVTKADTDKDGTLDKAELEAALGSSFKAADTDNDGTVDAKELASPAGQKLATMLD